MGEVAVLVVDDDPFMREMLPRRLRLCAIAFREVRTSATPEDALSALDDVPGPLVVVSDFNLKASMNGLDVLREVGRRRPDTLRVLMSGYTLDQLGRRGEDTFHHFFEKPFQLDELVLPLCEAIARRFSGDPPPCADA